MKAIRTHLVVKLFLSYLAVVLAGALVLVVMVPAIVPQTFNRHFGNMNMMNTGGKGMPMQGGGQGLGNGANQNGGLMEELFVGFRDGVFESLAWASVMAVIAAVIVSLLLSRYILRPLRAMMVASQRIADGHYEERVQFSGVDELGQLAQRFNLMTEKLQQVETMRRQLIGDVSHELRTPLTAIKGSMEGLMDGILPSNTDTYEDIHHEADRLSRLVDDLQELSRVEAGAYELDLEPLDINVLTGAIVKRLRYQFNEKHVELSLSMPTDSPLVLADERRILQVLTNLVGNALQHTPSGGRVTVSAAREGELMQVSVHDTGVGISPEHMEHIFDRFYRVDKSRSRAGGGGSGIGLTIAKYFVEAHGGRIWVESAGKGYGSTFTFTLPLK